MSLEKVDPFLALLFLSFVGNVIVFVLKKLGWKSAAELTSALSPFAARAAVDAVRGEKTRSVSDLIFAVESLAMSRGWTSSHSDPQIASVVASLDKAKEEHPS